MCVIIVRDPGIDIPFDKIDSACHVNPDGFGLVFNDRGKMEVVKEFSPKGNNPERVFKWLEDTKDQKIALHLRFKTAGDTNLANCHPFEALSPEKDGIGVQFMHNGTLGRFTDSSSKLSDSYHFTMKVVRPLLQRIAKFGGPDTCLADPLLYEILDQYKGGSKFVLFDSNGNDLIIGKKDGKEFQGWWASNEYSFNRSHREPTWYGGSSYGSSYGGGSSTRNFREDYTWPDSDGEGAAVSQFPSSGSKIIKPAASDKKLSEIFAEMRKDDAVSPEVEERQERQTFTQVAELTELSECCRLEPEDIQELVTRFPDYAVLLIQDLLYELYMKDMVEEEEEEDIPDEPTPSDTQLIAQAMVAH